MKQTNKILYQCMIINLIISIIKITGGILFSLSSLLSDGIHTFSDFLTDIIKIFSVKIENKKANKSHPFGYGRVEYLSNLLVALILLILGLMILYNVFNHRYNVPPLTALIITITAVILKSINIYNLNKRAVKTHEKVLISSIEESKIDLYSTIFLSLVIIILQFAYIVPSIYYLDLLFSLVICFLVLKSSYNIFVDNSISIIGETEEEYFNQTKLEILIKEFKEIEKYEIELTKFGNYYRLLLKIHLKKNISLKHAFLVKSNLEKTILKHKSLKINYIIVSISE